MSVRAYGWLLRPCPEFRGRLFFSGRSLLPPLGHRPNMCVVPGVGHVDRPCGPRPGPVCWARCTAGPWLGIVRPGVVSVGSVQAWLCLRVTAEVLSQFRVPGPPLVKPGFTPTSWACVRVSRAGRKGVVGKEAQDSPRSYLPVCGALGAALRKQSPGHSLCHGRRSERVLRGPGPRVRMALPGSGPRGSGSSEPWAPSSLRHSGRRTPHLSPGLWPQS